MGSLLLLGGINELYHKETICKLKNLQPVHYILDILKQSETTNNICVGFREGHESGEINFLEKQKIQCLAFHCTTKSNLKIPLYSLHLSLPSCVDTSVPD